MNGKAQQRNVIPKQTIPLAGVVVSATHKAIYEKGIRFFLTVEAPFTAGGGSDGFFLCAIPPNGSAPIQIAGFTTVNLLSSPGSYMMDFYPGAWMFTAPPLGPLLGIAGVQVPMQWAVRLVMGAGNSTTITVDAELMP